MLEKGLLGKQEIVVTEEQTAKVYGSGSLRVFGTPAMIALMENTALKSVASYIGDGNGTVGTQLDVKHVSATPVGMKVTCETKLVEVEGRRLVFEVKAYDECGLIGEGT
ncbi:MAG: thioesterase, partial [Agathobacter sp.]|nr:thioesterase [Agathobacter sp.]